MWKDYHMPRLLLGYIKSNNCQIRLLQKSDIQFDKSRFKGENGMIQKQKETVLALLKSQMANKSFEINYWFPYKDFLNPTDDFTEFACENLDGKQEYITLIQNLLSADETAKIFVEVYGMEEDENAPFIHAETLIIFSKLSLYKVKEIFNAPKDIFPSDIGELSDFYKQNFIIDDNGDLLPVSSSYNSEQSIYYCWWD